MKKIFSKENLLKFFYSFIWLAIVVFAIDIASKWIVINHFGAEAIRTNTAPNIELIPQFLYITAQANEGAAWSLGSNMRVFWIIVSFVLSGGLIAYYVFKHNKMPKLVKATLMLMIAGAIGNLIDRTFYWNETVGFSGVVDWIKVWLPWGQWFPTFNIADSSLVIGVLILLVYAIVELIKEVKLKDKSGEYDLKPADLEAKQKTEAEEKDADVKEEKPEENKVENEQNNS